MSDIVYDQDFPLTGQKTVGITASQFVTDGTVRPCRGIEIFADPTNGGIVYVGMEGVTTGNGFAIFECYSLLVPTRYPSQIYTIASLADQKVYWMII